MPPNEPSTKYSSIIDVVASHAMRAAVESLLMMLELAHRVAASAACVLGDRERTVRGVQPSRHGEALRTRSAFAATVADSWLPVLRAKHSTRTNGRVVIAELLAGDGCLA